MFVLYTFYKQTQENPTFYKHFSETIRTQHVIYLLFMHRSDILQPSFSHTHHSNTINHLLKENPQQNRSRPRLSPTTGKSAAPTTSCGPTPAPAPTPSPAPSPTPTTVDVEEEDDQEGVVLSARISWRSAASARAILSRLVSVV